MNISFVGAGNLAVNLAKALYKSGHNIIQIYSRTEESAKSLADKVNAKATIEMKKINREADLYIFSVSDSILAELTLSFLHKDKLCVHTAGSIPMSVFGNDYENAGVFYPLQTFSKSKEVNFNEIPICVEAKTSTLKRTLIELGSTISDDLRLIDSKQRQAIHLSAVFSCNFTNHLMHVADSLLADSEIDFDILLPLIRETLSKLNHMKPKDAQTGPAVRKDMNVIDKHVSELTSKPEFQKLYMVLSNSIIDTENK
jgi:predicted short-subunit dehydrogenase-like oxidoreductase (DUF2520 family)